MSIYTTFVTSSQLISPVNGYTCRRITKQNIKQFGFNSIDELHQQFPEFPLMCDEYQSTRKNGYQSDKFKKHLLKERKKFESQKASDIENYNLSPSLCPNCGNPKSYEKRNNKFCSRSCGNRRIHSEETKNKIRIGVKLNPSGIVAMSKEEQQKIYERQRKPRIEKICETCGAKFTTKISESKDYCSRICNPNHGGYRKGSGRAYGGYYQGIYCHSTYELVWVMYNLYHKKDFEVCKEVFDYFDKSGTKRKYHPDFVQNNVIIEIKGYFTETVELKKKSVLESGRKIKILYKNDLQPMFDWFYKSYKDKKLHEMYEVKVGPASRI